MIWYKREMSVIPKMMYSIGLYGFCTPGRTVVYSAKYAPYNMITSTQRMLARGRLSYKKDAATTAFSMSVTTSIAM